MLMRTDLDRVKMWRPNNQQGATILRKNYRLICDFIIAELRHADEITFSQLLEKASLHLSSHFFGDVSWHLLQVKADLEERGVIKVYFTRDRQQLIKPLKKLKTFSSSDLPTAPQGPEGIFQDE